MSMRLTYHHGKFTLRECRRDFPDTSPWTKVADDIFTTSDFLAAVAFRRYADSACENVFNKAFVKKYIAPTLPPLSFLEPHQKEGVRWALSRGRSYLAHAPGAGKTLETILVAMLAAGEGQCVCIVPPDLTVNWAREVLKWTQDVEVMAAFDIWPSVKIVPDGSEKENFDGWRADFLIVPDSMLTKNWVYEKLLTLKIKVLAIDEASRFKEITSERTLALFGGYAKARRYKGLYHNARHVVLLDGSPMPNRPIELWGPVYAMSPESINFMSQVDFGIRYCGARRNDWGAYEFKGSTNEEELRSRLQASFMHVVTEDKLNHSERKRSLLFINKDPRDIKLKTWEQKTLAEIDFSTIDENTSQGEIAELRKETGLAKVDWSAKYIAKLLEENKDESILVFAWHREVCQRLAIQLRKYSPTLVIGGTKSTDRENYFSSFNSGKHRLNIGNILAMGRGHNLPRADHCVFVEYAWNDELNKQCEKRASRKGRDADLPVKCDYIVIPYAMDERVLNAVFRKQRLTKKVIG